MAKLVERIRERIRSRYCVASEYGARLPSERQLVRELGVSRATLRSAMGDLVRQGHLRRYRGRGTFVADPSSRIPPSQTRGATIGVVIRGLSSELSAKFTHDLLDALHQHGAATLISMAEEDPLRELADLQQAVDRNVDGILLQPLLHRVLDSKTYQARLRQLELGVRTPCVLMGESNVYEDCTSVWFDDEQVGYMATKHLIEQGHKKIAHISLLRTPTVARRAAGYCRAMEEAGLPIPDGYMLDIGAVPRDPISWRMGSNAAKILFSLADPPTAVFAYWAEAAAGMMIEAHRRGMKPGVDFAAIGVAHVEPSTQYVLPCTMSTVWYDLGELARRSVEELFREVEGESCGRRIELQTEIRPGESTMGKKAGFAPIRRRRLSTTRKD